MTYLETVLLEKLEKLEKRIDELEAKLGESYTDSPKNQIVKDINTAIEKTQSTYYINSLKELRTKVLADQYDLSSKYQISLIYMEINRAR